MARVSQTTSWIESEVTLSASAVRETTQAPAVEVNGE
jgi:hypothetical protein